MSFSWNAFSPILISIDIVALFFAGGCLVWRFKRVGGLPAQPVWVTLKTFREAFLLSVIPWMMGVLILSKHGILGLALLSRVLWTLATVGVPLTALALLFRWRKSWLWLLVLVPLAFKYYGEVWEPGNLEVERMRIQCEGLRNPVRIVHLSDLQTDGIGKMQLAARDAANDFDPHLVFFTGDVLNHPTLTDSVEAYLNGFRSKAGAFFVTGNVDGMLDVPSFCSAAGLEDLGGKARLLDVDGSRIGIMGLDLWDFADTRVLGSLVSQTAGADVRLLLSHVPDTLKIANSCPIDVLFAGHTHGGQVALPFMGPLLTMSNAPRSITRGGLHQVGNLRVIVSRGLGWEGHIAPRVRLFCRPHLILIELVPPPRLR
ncbi:MAG: metallophosphoesterase [Elusimicrobiota bacterium]|jgi:hypothetical protein